MEYLFTIFCDPIDVVEQIEKEISNRYNFKCNVNIDIIISLSDRMNLYVFKVLPKFKSVNEPEVLLAIEIIRPDLKKLFKVYKVCNNYWL